MTLITRATQEVEVIYELEGGECFLSPDGEGRLWYEDVDEAEENHPGCKVVSLLSYEFDSEEP